MRVFERLLCGVGLVFMLASAKAAEPVIIGFDSEKGVRHSTSDLAIRLGIKIAIDEINAAGGVLGGRKLKLEERTNRSVPARSVENIKQFALDDNVAAVFCGRFSPTVLHTLDIIHELGMPLLNPWAAADRITQHNYEPSYTFRISLRDSWAMQAMLREVARRGHKRVGVLLPLTGWGRSNQKALAAALGEFNQLTSVGTLWYNWGDDTLISKYLQLSDGGAETIIYVGNDREGTVLVKEVGALPQDQRLPILSHWGVSGGRFFQQTKGLLVGLDFQVVQTYSFLRDNPDERTQRIISEVEKRAKLNNIAEFPSPVGVAHAYDLMHVLALAIDKAGTIDRAKVRTALEQVASYDGLIKRYEPPFTSDRHDGLSRDDVFFASYRKDGALVPVRH
jgi:branched-chain amino acid transport system substrate-binding protein